MPAKIIVFPKEAVGPELIDIKPRPRGLRNRPNGKIYDNGYIASVIKLQTVYSRVQRRGEFLH